MKNYPACKELIIKILFSFQQFGNTNIHKKKNNNDIQGNLKHPEILQIPFFLKIIEINIYFNSHKFLSY